jgi:hypothetical protein
MHRQSGILYLLEKNLKETLTICEPINNESQFTHNCGQDFFLNTILKKSKFLPTQIALQLLQYRRK